MSCSSQTMSSPAPPASTCSTSASIALRTWSSQSVPCKKPQVTTFWILAATTSPLQGTINGVQDCPILLPPSVAKFPGRIGSPSSLVWRPALNSLMLCMNPAWRSTSSLYFCWVKTISAGLSLIGWTARSNARHCHRYSSIWVVIFSRSSAMVQQLVTAPVIQVTLRMNWSADGPCGVAKDPLIHWTY